MSSREWWMEGLIVGYTVIYFDLVVALGEK
jgi:hypothetical protein